MTLFPTDSLELSPHYLWAIQGQMARLRLPSLEAGRTVYESPEHAARHVPLANGLESFVYSLPERLEQSAFSGRLSISLPHTHILIAKRSHVDSSSILLNTDLDEYIVGHQVLDSERRNLGIILQPPIVEESGDSIRILSSHNREPIAVYRPPGGIRDGPSFEHPFRC